LYLIDIVFCFDVSGNKIIKLYKIIKSLKCVLDIVKQLFTKNRFYHDYICIMKLYISYIIIINPFLRIVIEDVPIYYYRETSTIYIYAGYMLLYLYISKYPIYIYKSNIKQ